MNAPRGILVVLEGLSGSGKSSVAGLLQQPPDVVFLPTIPPEFESARRFVDAGDSLRARFYVYLAANYALSSQLRQLLASGTTILLESYFYRTLGTHKAMGVDDVPKIDWTEAIRPDLTLWLAVEEEERLARLTKRDGSSAKSKWHGRVRPEIEKRFYDELHNEMRVLDTTLLAPEDVAQQALQLIRESRGRLRN